MALAIAQDVAEAIAKKVKPSRRLVKFRRRGFDEDLQDFVLEPVATQLLRADVRSISSTREAVDRKGINIFESSNITIELNNKDNRWNPVNSSGIFGPPTPNGSFFEPQLMEFIVELIYTLEDGTESAPIPVFTGRAVDFDMRPQDDTVSITVESRAILAKRSDAENVSTPFTNEAALATGDPKVFETAVSGVARTGVKVLAVRVNGLPKKLGSEVVLSQENDPDLPAKLSFRDDLGGGPDVRVDFIEWFKNQTIDVLFGLLADEADIPALDRAIDEVLFPNFLVLTKTFTTQEDFDAGTLVNIDTVTTPDQFTIGPFLVDDFSDNDFTTNPTWTALNFGGTISAASGALVLSNTPADGLGFPLISLPFTKSVGAWRANISCSRFGQWFYFATSNSQDGFGNPTGSGYFLNLNGATGTVEFNRLDGGATTVLFSVGGIAVSGTRSYRITRDGSGNFELFIDGVSKGTVTDATHTTNAFVMVREDSNIASNAITFDDFEFTDPVPGVWTSAVFDSKTGFREWLKLNVTSTIPGGTSIVVETAVADESFPGSGVPGAFDAFVAIDAQSNIQSANKRFIQVRITLNRGDPFQFITPIIFDAALTFVGVTLEIALANFSDFTVFEAMTELAKNSNFEWGFTRAGVLFFRARTASTVSVLTIDLPSLKSFTRISDGVERVRNSVRAKFGTHESTVDPISEGEGKPNSFDRNGRRFLSLSSTQLLLDLDADVATGLARSYFVEFKERRRLFELDVSLKPQLELGDTVEFRVRDAIPNLAWHVGDTSKAIGDKDIHLYGEVQQAAFKVKARILSLRNDTGGMNTGLVAEEVLNGA